jgi:hypothetical protein
MSTTSEPIRPKSSAFSRYFFVFLIGLVIGAICVVTLLRTLDARKTWQDRWHEAAMHVMNAQTRTLEDKVAQNRCGATDILPSLQALRSLANDLEPAFPGLRDDERFVKHASALRAALDGAMSPPPMNCEAVGAVVKKIDETCMACHQEFR